MCIEYRKKASSLTYWGVVLPVVKGPQILEMLRSETHTKDIPVMFLTSNNDRESIISVMSLNPVNYLLKTLPRSEIYGKIKAFFEQ